MMQCISGLKCVCQLCANHTCETTADGACWNSVMLIDGKEETVKSCLSPSEMKGQVFCYSSRNVSKRNCCFTDFCNNETLHLPPGAVNMIIIILYKIGLINTDASKPSPPMVGNWVFRLSVNATLLTTYSTESTAAAAQSVWDFPLILALARRGACWSY